MQQIDCNRQQTERMSDCDYVTEIHSHIMSCHIKTEVTVALLSPYLCGKLHTSESASAFLTLTRLVGLRK